MLTSLRSRSARRLNPLAQIDNHGSIRKYGAHFQFAVHRLDEIAERAQIEVRPLFHLAYGRLLNLKSLRHLFFG